MLSKLFQQGINEFNQQEFYACHDTLEAIWSDSVEPDKTFYQGILQVAVGCHHLGNNNWRGAVILLGEGIKKLIEYEPEYLGVNVIQLTDDSHDLLTHLQKIQPEEINTFYEQLSQGKLKDKLALPKITSVRSKNC